MIDEKTKGLEVTRLGNQITDLTDGSVLVVQ